MSDNSPGSGEFDEYPSEEGDDSPILTSDKDGGGKEPDHEGDDNERDDPDHEKDEEGIGSYRQGNDIEKDDPDHKRDDNEKDDPNHERDDNEKDDPNHERDDNEKDDPNHERDDNEKDDPNHERDDNEKEDPDHERDDNEKDDPNYERDNLLNHDTKVKENSNLAPESALPSPDLPPPAREQHENHADGIASREKPTNSPIPGEKSPPNDRRQSKPRPQNAPSRSPRQHHPIHPFSHSNIDPFGIVKRVLKLFEPTPGDTDHPAIPCQGLTPKSGSDEPRRAARTANHPLSAPRPHIRTEERRPADYERDAQEREKDRKALTHILDNLDREEAARKTAAKALYQRAFGDDKDAPPPANPQAPPRTGGSHQSPEPRQQNASEARPARRGPSPPSPS
jgi:hypothetical protein